MERVAIIPFRKSASQCTLPRCLLGRISSRLDCERQEKTRNSNKPGPRTPHKRDLAPSHRTPTIRNINIKITNTLILSRTLTFQASRRLLPQRANA